MTRLTSTPPLAICRKKRSSTPTPISTMNSASHSKACTRLEAGPASATQIMSRLGLRRLLKLTGTGLA